MRITCPQCGFFRDIPDNKVPVTSTMATCPKCRHRFKFRPEPTAHWSEERRLADVREETPAPAEHEAPSSWRRAPAGVRERHPDPDEPRAVRDIPAPPPSRPAQAAPDDTVPADRPAPRSAARSDPEPEVPDRAPEPEYPQPQPQAGPSTSAPAQPTPRELPPDPPADPATDTPPQPAVAAPPQPTTPPASETPPDRPAETAQATRNREVDADGVRDIWARLQAMDAPPHAHDETTRPSDDAEPQDATSPAASDPVPWERQDIYEFLPSLFLTLRQILLHPTEFFSAMPEGRPRGRALVFNLLISEFLLVIDFLWSLMGLRPKLGSGEGDLVGAVSASPSLSFLLALLLVPPLLAVGIYLDAWLTHLLLLLFRSAKKGFSETFRVMCYSAAPTVVSAVPVAGQILSPLILVWYMALQAIGLRQIHQGGYTQVLAAVFIKWSLYLFMLLAILQGVAPQG